jgi:dTMP kinase
MSKKPIIVFEGIEGSGKSHHISVVSKFLDKKKERIILKLENLVETQVLKKLGKLILNNKSDFNKNT